jgi:hypothetical protein
VVGALPFWDIGNGTRTVLAHRGDFTEVSPWIYGLAASGRIDTQYDPAQAAAINADITRLRQAGLTVVPTLANITKGNWSYPPVARMLHHPALLKQHVSGIVALVLAHHYAGIDIDYENLHAADRHAFTTFITSLAAALHSHGKTLSVAVFAKTANAGYGGANLAQDYAALGRAADQMRIMAYNYHWAASPPGPVAPIGWVRAVLRYAKTQIPANKIILGIPLYGFDWSGGRGSAVTCSLPATTPARPTTPPPRSRGSAIPRPATGTSSGSRTRPARGRSSRRPLARGQAGSSCGCSVTRTPGPGARCTPRCPCRAGHDDSLVGAGGGDPRRQLPAVGVG